MCQLISPFEPQWSMLAVSPFFGALLRGICKISGMDPFLSPSGYCCGHWSRNNGGVCLAFNLTTLDISKWLQELFHPTLPNRGRLPPARAVRLTSTRAARCACFRTPWSIYTFLHHSKHLSPLLRIANKVATGCMSRLNQHVQRAAGTSFTSLKRKGHRFVIELLLPLPANFSFTSVWAKTSACWYRI